MQNFELIEFSMDSSSPPKKLKQKQREFMEVLEYIKKNRLGSLSLKEIFRAPGNEGPCRTLEGHTDQINQLLLLPENRLASGALDKTIRIWDIQTRMCLHELKGHTDQINQLLLLPDNKLASGASDGTIRFWDLNEGKLEYIVDKSEAAVRQLQLLSGNQLASGFSDGKIMIFGIKTGVRLCLFKDHLSQINQLLHLSDNQLASGSSDKTIRIWDIKTRKCLNILRGHTGNISQLLLLSESQLASGASDNTIRIWNIKTGECLHVLKAHKGQITQLLLLSANQLASGSSDGDILLWDIKTGKCVNKLGNHGATVTKLLRLPNELLASSSWDKTICIWSIKTNKPIQLFKGHTDWITQLLPLPDGQLASGSLDNTVKITELEERPLNTQELEYLLKKLVTETPNIEQLNCADVPWTEACLEQLQQLVDKPCYKEKRAWIINPPLEINGKNTALVLLKNRPECFDFDAAVLSVRNSTGGTVLHDLVRLYDQIKPHTETDRNRRTALKGLVDRCLYLGVNAFVHDDNGYSPHGLATELNCKSLVKRFKNYRKEDFNFTQVVLDWCADQGWDDVVCIDGGDVSTRLVDSVVLAKQKTMPKTKMLGIETISTDKRQVNQRNEIITNTRQHVVLKIENVLSDSNRSLEVITKSRDTMRTEQNQQANTNTQDKRRVESKNWNSQGSVEVTTELDFWVFKGSAKASVSGGLGGNTENTTGETTQQQNLTSQGEMKKNSESSQKHQEQQQRISFSDGKEQQRTIEFTKKLISDVTFKEGYHFIASEEETRWTEHKKSALRFSVTGNVKIKRESSNQEIVRSIGGILKDRQHSLKQTYPDYEWNCEKKNNIQYTLFCDVKEDNVITEKGCHEHPLYRIKRLMEELVTLENMNRKQQNESMPAWLVNIRVYPNKINPYEGKIEVRCNEDTSTAFLKEALIKFVAYSAEEKITITKLEDGATLLTLTFDEIDQYMLQKPRELKFETKSEPQSTSESSVPPLLQISSEVV